MNKQYVTYHLHSDDSLLDSATDYHSYIDYAESIGQKAIAFTEHGNIYHWVSKCLYCQKHNIKYIHGVEIYLTEQLEPKLRDNYHTVLLAKNQAGIEEINTLVSISNDSEHFYYKPRITFDEFFNISSNVIKISACLASPLNQYESSINEIDAEIIDLHSLLQEKQREYQAVIDKEAFTGAEEESVIREINNNIRSLMQRKENIPIILDKLLKTYDYYEIQPHVNSTDQIFYNDKLYQLSQQYHKPLISGTDTHSLNSYKAECRTILKRAKHMEYGNEDEFDLTYKTYDELVEMYKEQGALSEEIYLEAIENTNKMADLVEDVVIDLAFKYPILYGDAENDEKVFNETIERKLKSKIENGIIPEFQIEDFKINNEEEKRVFKKIEMSGFMLFMSELITWCKENDIPVGFNRGSCGGSRVAYVTDITDLNPETWKTVFSRFCNEDRKEIGD